MRAAAVWASAGAHALEQLQRKDAGAAYRKQASYYNAKVPSLGELEALLSGQADKRAESPGMQQAVRDYQQIESTSAQRAQTAGDRDGAPAPVPRPLPQPVQTVRGTSLEDTIRLLERVRKAALAPQAPSEQDYRVAASASAQIERAERQLGLDRSASAQIERTAHKASLAEADTDGRTAVPRPDVPPMADPKEAARLRIKRAYERAVEKYAYQADLKRSGFQIQQPSVFRIA